MKNSSSKNSKVWFKGENEISCSFDRILKSFKEPAKHFHEIVSIMPGLSEVEIQKEGPDFVHITTNEGLMKRTNISMNSGSSQLIVEFDEEYDAGKATSTTSHFRHQFSNNKSNVSHLLIISGVSASGFLGFFYKNLGSSSIGKSFLKTYKKYFEQ